MILEETSPGGLKFDGDVTKLRGCMFALMVAIGQVDSRSAKEINRLEGENVADKWNPEREESVDEEFHENRTSELHGILCLRTPGEAKGILKGCNRMGKGHSGR